MGLFVKGHRVIDAEKLNNFLKNIIPDDRFDRNFIAYKIAEHEDEFVRDTVMQLLNRPRP